MTAQDYKNKARNCGLSSYRIVKMDGVYHIFGIQSNGRNFHYKTTSRAQVEVIIANLKEGK